MHIVIMILSFFAIMFSHFILFAHIEGKPERPWAILAAIFWALTAVIAGVGV
jgi:heme/copper-type cytochrome/quinol oxidase subunit 4